MKTCPVGLIVMYVFVTDGWQSSQQSTAQTTQTWDQTLGPGRREELDPSMINLFYLSTDFTIIYLFSMEMEI